jgi:hypothetical protein
VRCHRSVFDCNVALMIYDSSFYRLVDVNTALRGKLLRMAAGDRATVSFRIKELLLKPGTYNVGVWLGQPGGEEFDFIEHALRLDIVEPRRPTSHTEVFPGPYQCRFDADVALTRADAAPEHALCEEVMK